MSEANAPETIVPRADETLDTDAKEARLAEATGGDTLSDLRRDEKLTGTNSDTRDHAITSSPDGTTTAHDSRGRADGSDTGEPM